MFNKQRGPSTVCEAARFWWGCDCHCCYGAITKSHPTLQALYNYHTSKDLATHVCQRADLLLLPCQNYLKRNIQIKLLPFEQLGVVQSSVPQNVCIIIVNHHLKCSLWMHQPQLTLNHPGPRSDFLLNHFNDKFKRTLSWPLTNCIVLNFFRC